MKRTASCTNRPRIARSMLITPRRRRQGAFDQKVSEIRATVGKKGDRTGTGAMTERVCDRNSLLIWKVSSPVISVRVIVCIVPRDFPGIGLRVLGSDCANSEGHAITLQTAPARQNDRSKRPTERTHLIHRPAIFPLLGGTLVSPIGFDPERFSCRGLLPGPPELGAVNPDAGGVRAFCRQARIKGGLDGPTAKRWRPVIKRFVEWIKHRDFTRVTSQDAVRRRRV